MLFTRLPSVILACKKHFRFWFPLMNIFQALWFRLHSLRGLQQASQACPFNSTSIRNYFSLHGRKWNAYNFWKALILGWYCLTKKADKFQNPYLQSIGFYNQIFNPPCVFSYPYFRTRVVFTPKNSLKPAILLVFPISVIFLKFPICFLAVFWLKNKGSFFALKSLKIIIYFRSVIMPYIRIILFFRNKFPKKHLLFFFVSKCFFIVKILVFHATDRNNTALLLKKSILPNRFVHFSSLTLKPESFLPIKTVSNPQ